MYVVKYSTRSAVKANGTILPGTDVNHLECAFFYVSAPAIRCGNGVPEGTEQCDDGNTNNVDDCSNTCRTPVCGNGVREGTEQCDDGDTNNNNGCTNTCRTGITLGQLC